MTRTARYKAVYFMILGLGGCSAAALLWYFGPSLPVFLAVILLLLIPGRVLGYFWRDLLRGLRLLNLREYAASKACSERFLAYYERQPWIRHLIWLGSGTYSRNPKAMALNNLGAAEIPLGETDAARRHLYKSIEIDPLNPLPFYNLSVLARVQGDVEGAARCSAHARALGFSRGVSDAIVRSSQNRFATLDGRGR
jgi:hypothetical protein